MLTSISLALALLQAPAAVTLRYQPALNKPYRYASTTTMVQQMPGGKSITITQKAVTVMKATARSNGKTTLLTTNESATVTVPKDSPMAGMAKSMEDNLKKMKVQSTMDATGKVVDSKMTGAS